MAARKRKITLSDDWKDKIRAGVLMQKLLAHVEGTNDMTSTQVKAADILLKKIVPDLARTELTGKDGTDLFNREEDAAALAHFKAKMENQKLLQ